MKNPAGDRAAAEGICERGTHADLPLYISVSVPAVSSSHRMRIMLKALCLNIYEILPGLRHSQIRRCAELRNGARWGLAGRFWG